MKKLLRAKYISLLALAAFTLATILPFYAVYSLPENTRAEISSIFGDKILICTLDGFRFISASEMAEGHETPVTHEQYECPLCPVKYSGYKAILPVAGMFEYPSCSSVVQLSFDFVSHGRQLLLLHNSPPRAPPFVG